MRCTLGTQLAVLMEGDKLFVKDMSIYGRNSETMLRAIKGKEVPIKENDLLTLS